MKTDMELIEKIALRNSEIRMWGVAPVRAVYDGPIVTPGRSRIEVSGPNGMSEIKTMEEFCAAVRAGHEPSLQNEKVEAIARIARELLGAGRVVTAHELFSYLEDDFHIRLLDNLPRIESDRLRFLAIRSDLSRGIHGLEDIEVELASGRVVRRPVPKP